MTTHPEVIAWRNKFVAIFKSTVLDSRLWFIVLPAAIIVALVLAFIKAPYGGVVSIVVGLVASHLIRKVETLLPKPDEKKLAESICSSIVLPALVGIFVIPSFDVFARVCLLPWNWLHADYSGLPCSYIGIAVALGWLGLVIAPAITAVLVRERAIFATVVGLMVLVPLGMVDTFAHGAPLKVASLISQSCQMDFDPSTDLGDVRSGMITGAIIQILLPIFVAKFVSMWLGRRSVQLPGRQGESAGLIEGSR
jgi:hypothetical protein